MGVNRDIHVCMQNQFSRPVEPEMYGGLDIAYKAPHESATLAGRKVPLRPLWRDRAQAALKKRWKQLLVAGDCDDFVAAFFDSPAAREQGLQLGLGDAASVQKSPSSP